MKRRQALSEPALRVLRELLRNWDEGEPLHGYALLQATGLRSGTLYPILARLRKQGWVVGAQDPDEGRAVPRTYYRLTEEGVTEALEVFVRLSP